MGNILYLECNTGISGDMAVAALLDLGASEEAVRSALDSLPLEGFRVEISRVKKSGLDCCDFNVVLDGNLDNHDHDMEYLYGHLHAHDGDHDHHAHVGNHGQHHHDEHHDHHHHDGDDDHHAHDGHHDHHHVHRGMKEIREILDRAEMTEGARDLARRIFGIIAEAEAEAHGTTVEKVHFHEVGAVDSIVDVVAAAVCLDDLKIKETIITGIAEGSGTVRCAHGILSVPVPAVASIARAHALPVRMTGRQGELITPTGAAIAAAICTGNTLPDSLLFERTGLGAGKRNYETPSILRAFLVSPLEDRQGTAKQENRIWKLETNIDDCTGEDLGFVMDELFRAGVRDVFYTPIYMKKNRPGILLSVLCMEDEIARAEEIIFRETTTIGIRRCPYERSVLPRRKEIITLDCGQVEVKICTLPDGRERIYPEYESVCRLSRSRGTGRREILAEILKYYESSAAGRQRD